MLCLNDASSVLSRTFILRNSDSNSSSSVVDGCAWILCGVACLSIPLVSVFSLIESNKIYLFYVSLGEMAMRYYVYQRAFFSWGCAWYSPVHMHPWKDPAHQTHSRPCLLSLASFFLRWLAKQDHANCVFQSNTCACQWMLVLPKQNLEGSFYLVFVLYQVHLLIILMFAQR